MSSNSSHSRHTALFDSDEQAHHRASNDDEEEGGARASSETTIFTIYSMYSERHGSVDASQETSYLKDNSLDGGRGGRASGVGSGSGYRDTLRQSDVTSNSASSRRTTAMTAFSGLETFAAYNRAYADSADSARDSFFLRGAQQHQQQQQSVSRTASRSASRSASAAPSRRATPDSAATSSSAFFTPAETPTMGASSSASASATDSPQPADDRPARKLSKRVGLGFDLDSPQRNQQLLTPPSSTAAHSPRTAQKIASWTKFVDVSLSSEGDEQAFNLLPTPQATPQKLTKERERPPRNTPPQTSPHDTHGRISTSSSRTSKAESKMPSTSSPQSSISVPTTPPLHLKARRSGDLKKSPSTLRKQPPRFSESDQPPPPSASGSALPKKPSKEEKIADEDADGRFVRNTYALLDQKGVQGDGFVEGIERTRAKASISSRQSLMQNGPSDRANELSQDERNILQSLDRYGFFVVPSHDRLVSLPKDKLSKPLSHIPNSPRPNTPSHPASPSFLSSIPPSQNSPKELSRIAKWGRMLESGGRDAGGNVQRWRVRAGKESKLHERTFKGVPDRWRAAAWGLFVERSTGVKGKGKAVERLEELGVEYKDRLEKPSSYDVQIDLDVPRTINGHVLFRTRYGLG